MYDLIIIGGGAAGLAAAFYAIEKQLNVVMLYEALGGKVGWRESLIGPLIAYQPITKAYQPVLQQDGQVLDHMPPLPANDLVRLLARRTMRSGRVIHDHALTVSKGPSFFSIYTQAQGMLQATAVLVATGATPRLLKVPGAERLIDRGLGYSITTYAHLAAAKRIAVIGSTTRALLGTAELAQTAERVYLIMPDAEDLATPLAHALQLLPNVEVLAGWQVTAVSGTTAIKEVQIVCDQQNRQLSVHCAFVDLGLVPNSDLVRGTAKTDARGFIVVDHDNMTTVPGLFAAGDVTTMPNEQVLIAIGDGARAALSAYKYLLAWSLAQQQAGSVG